MFAQAARSALSAAARPAAVQGPEETAEEDRELPAFGAGLEFRPQGKLAASKSAAGEAEAAARADNSALAISIADEEELGGDEDDEMDDDVRVRQASAWQAVCMHASMHFGA